MRPIKRLVVHCSATRPSMDIGVDWINKEHLKRGFKPTPTSPAVGYHKIILRDGTVENGRPESRIGAHAEGYNADSLAVCLIGGVKEDGKTPDNNYTPAQFEALKVVLRGWIQRYGNVEIVGHCDLTGGSQVCPCFDVSKWRDLNLPNLSTYRFNGENNG